MRFTRTTGHPGPSRRRKRNTAAHSPHGNDLAAPFRIAAFFLAVLILALTVVSGSGPDQAEAASPAQSATTVHEALFIPGSPFNVGEILYPSAHDFDSTNGIDTCLSLNVPPGDTFTLSLTWEALFDGPPGAGDLDLYIYLDAACTESAVLTSSFNSNAYTGELLEITPQVRNIGSSAAVAGIRIGKRSGRGNPGLLRLTVLTGTATFLEHGTDGPPLEGQDGAPVFVFSGPFSVPENSAPGTAVGTVTASDPQADPLTYFELEPAAGQTSFHINPQTGAITVEDPAALDREATGSLVYWIGVTDGVSASLAGVAIDLGGVNDNTPVALDGTAVTTPGSAVVVTLHGTDADIDPAQPLTMSIVSPPANGSLSAPVQGGSTSATVLYTPAPGFVGTDSFTFEVGDGHTASSPGTVTITVSDDPPAVLPTAPTGTPAAGLSPTPTASPFAGQSPTPVAPLPTTTAPPTGGGSASPASSAPTPQAAPVDAFTTPTAPRFLRAQAGDGSVALSWQRPLSDGGAPILGYRIFNVHTAEATFIDGDVLAGPVHGLENGVAYLFQVRAINAAGFGEGALVGPVIPLSGDPVTLDVQASIHPDDSVTVWWFPPEGERLKPVSDYTLWADGGELIEVFGAGESLILNIDGLEGDSWHSFRVTASDGDGDLVAAGVAEAVYVPPGLADDYDPLPPDAILVPLTEDARTQLQLSIRAAASGEGAVPDTPALLTVRDGTATVFVFTEGLHRALDLPPGFSVRSDQLVIGDGEDGALHVDLEIATGLRLLGAAEIAIDRTGILFSLPRPELVFRYSLPGPGRPATGFEVEYSPVSLLPGFLFEANLPDELPGQVADLLGGPSVRAIAALVEVSAAGMTLSDSARARVRFTVSSEWHEGELASGRDVRLIRIDSDGLMTTATALCEPASDTGEVECVGFLDAGSGEISHYALVSRSDAPEPEPEPTAQQQPTPLSAPTGPAPVSGPSLVVVEQPTPTATAVRPAAPEPAPTAASTATPELPALQDPGGGGTSVITWFMSGILGLVVLRGAFYAVGRIRS